MKLSKIHTLLTVAALTTFSTQALAALSGTLVLKGNVPAVLEITVTSEAVASALPLDTTQVDTLVAIVNEKSNSTTGYKVSIASANLGKLVHESETSSAINYSLSYAGNIIDLANGSEFTYPAVPTDEDRNVNISYTGVPHGDLYEGNYSDEVSFTIAAN